MLKHVDTLDLLPVVVVLWAGFFAVIALIDSAFGWPLRDAFRTPPNAREACPDCGDPAGEGACEAGPCTLAPYVPEQRDIAEGYIRLIEERAR